MEIHEVINPVEVLVSSNHWEKLAFYVMNYPQILVVLGRPCSLPTTLTLTE